MYERYPMGHAEPTKRAILSRARRRVAYFEEQASPL